MTKLCVWVWAGLYMGERLNGWVNAAWCAVFRRSTNKIGERPYDLIRPLAAAALVSLQFLLPLVPIALSHALA